MTIQAKASAGILDEHELVHAVEPLATDSPYYRNLHNADKMPQSQIIPYIVYSGNLPTPKYRHQDMPQWTKSNKFPSESGQSHARSTYTGVKQF